jgi:hypothetical protein
MVNGEQRLSVASARHATPCAALRRRGDVQDRSNSEHQASSTAVEVEETRKNLIAWHQYKGEREETNG